jgi:tape measure domain-containing protein|nr:MAG TPA: Tail tape measure [Caudoviricetes sp.]
MAKIQETLVLQDRFSSAFSSYLKYAQKAAVATGVLRTSANGDFSKVVDAIVNVNSSLADMARAQTDVAKSMQEQKDTLGELASAATKAAEAAQKATTANRDHKKSTDEAKKSADQLTQSLKSLVASYISIQGLKKAVDLSDSLVSMRARLDRMNDGLQTTQELETMIYQSAQRSRGSFTDTIGLVSQLGTMAGDAFSSSKEIVQFAEQLNKQLALSGASGSSAQAAILQLEQGLASGVLRGDELNSVMEQAPALAKSIADYMQVSVGELREMGSQGQITADIVKNALFAAAKDTNAEFEKTPMTWAQVWTVASNTAVRALDPLLTAINWVANNLDVAIPLVVSLGAAFGVLLIAANWTNILATATKTAASMQAFYNAVMAANPIALTAAAVLALVAALYGGVAAFNKLTGSSISATGIITGAFTTMGAVALNTFVVPVWNCFAALINFFLNSTDNFGQSFTIMLNDLYISFLQWVQGIAQAFEKLVQKIPVIGEHFGFTEGLGFNSYVEQKKNENQNRKNSMGWTDYMKPIENFDLGKSYKAGYNWGANLGKSGLIGTGTGQLEIPQAADVKDLLGNIEKNTGKIAKTVDLSDEQIKMLVDVAERKYVNNVNLTSQTPMITVQGQNTGNTEKDARNLADTLRDVLVDLMNAGSTVTVQ